MGVGPRPSHQAWFVFIIGIVSAFLEFVLDDRNIRLSSDSRRNFGGVFALAFVQWTIRRRRRRLFFRNFRRSLRI
jgi:hypothetical protein